jgi:hypothetical protein
MQRLPPGIVRNAFTFSCVLILASAPCSEAASQKSHQKKSSREVSVYIPKDLEECFAELDKLLLPKDREEFRNKSESDLIQYHFEFGMWIRNNWRLWGESRLQQYFAALGVPHPESISMIILTSYWRRENHQEIKLEEQIAKDRAEWEQQEKEQKEEENRAVQALDKIRELMLGFEYVSDPAPTVVMRQRSDDGIRARFLARFRDGVFLTVREIVSSEGLKDTYTLLPHFLDLKTQRIHPVRLPEVPDISFSLITGDRLWVVGKSKGELRLLALDAVDRKIVALPRSDEIPQLGLSGDQLLLVYSTSIFRREGEDWKQLYSGDIRLPFSGQPPRQHGDKIYFRDEGSGENEKQLWYLELGTIPRLVTVWQDTGLVGPSGPRWENTFGYCVLSDGTLWVTFGEGSVAKSLVRRQPNGDYRIAVFNDEVVLRGDLLGRSDENGPRIATTSGSGSKEMAAQRPDAKSAGLSISGLAARSDEDLVAVGDRGLFEIRGNQIRRLVGFRNTHQRVPIESGLLHWGWDPTDILFLPDNAYLISGSFGGIYLVRQDESKRWILKSLDEHLGRPLIW